MDEVTPPQTSRIIIPGSALDAGETSLTPQMRATEVGTVPPWLSIGRVSRDSAARSPRSSGSSLVGVERKESGSAKTPRGSRTEEEEEEKLPAQRHHKAARVSGEADAASSGEWGSYQTGAATRVASKEEAAKLDEEEDDEDEDEEESEDEGEDNDEDDGLQMLLQMRQSRTAAAATLRSPALRQGSQSSGSSCATPPLAATPAEPLEPGWDAAGSAGSRRT